MADKIYDVGRFRHSIDNWQLSMLLGIIFFIVGIVVFFEPGGTYPVSYTHLTLPTIA